MPLENKTESFKLVIRPGDRKLQSGDYWAILSLCAIGAFVLLMLIGSSI
ncbi:MAG: hypothetical protein PHO91_04080 [Patescibacteria group bacterium]|nr:hypothetical protein [Patescibacteria group bacterium]